MSASSCALGEVGRADDDRAGARGARVVVAGRRSRPCRADADGEDDVLELLLLPHAARAVVRPEQRPPADRSCVSWFSL